MPNNKNIDILIAALRSGQYKKGVGALHTTKIKPLGVLIEEIDENSCHCCLGVAECIMPPDLRGDQTDMTEGIEGARIEAVSGWLGTLDHQICTIMQINDYNNTFDSVIEYLEKIKENG